MPPDYSPEDQHLKELAILSPKVIQHSFIFSYFKSLRIVNKNVSGQEVVFVVGGWAGEDWH